MEKDRGEMCNLAVKKNYKKIVKEHRMLLSEWMKKHPLPGKQSATRFIPM